jgi:hypothetical protein
MQSIPQTRRSFSERSELMCPLSQVRHVFLRAHGANPTRVPDLITTADRQPGRIALAPVLPDRVINRLRADAPSLAAGRHRSKRPSTPEPRNSGEVAR